MAIKYVQPTHFAADVTFIAFYVLFHSLSLFHDPCAVLLLVRFLHTLLYPLKRLCYSLKLSEKRSCDRTVDLFPKRKIKAS